MSVVSRSRREVQHQLGAGELKGDFMTATEKLKLQSDAFPRG